MSQPGSGIASVFVARRGSIGAGAAMGAGGLVGAAIAVKMDKKGANSPIAAGIGKGAFLTVMPDSLVLYNIKKNLMNFKPKRSDEVLGQVQRAQLTGSRLKKGKLVSILELDFSDGSAWEFDVPRQFRKDAEQVAQVLGSSIE
ncbi:MAG: hypothetical protein ABR505_09060 [Actinomycetota bacterium]